MASAAELSSVIRGQQGCVVLVELYASWCAPCATIDPQVSALVAAHRPDGLVATWLGEAKKWGNNQPQQQCRQ